MSVKDQESRISAADFQRELHHVASAITRKLAAEAVPERVSPGWLRAAVTAYPRKGGKHLRPALVFWCCGLAGADPARAAHVALALELYHNWTLIHDDIVDGDVTRRGQPTCHVRLRRVAGNGHPAAVADKFGHDQAILAGDILHGWALACLARATEDGVSPQTVLALVTQLSGTVTPLLISGEAQDVAFPLLPPRRAADVMRMLTLKTATLLEYAAQAGFLIGAGGTHFAGAQMIWIGQFAKSAGLAFQLQDDLLGMCGDERELGKPVGADLREGKYTLLYLESLARTSAETRKLLCQLHGKKNLTARELMTAREIMNDCGAVAHLRALGARHLAKAHAALRHFPPGHYRELLAAWARFVTARSH